MNAKKIASFCSHTGWSPKLSRQFLKDHDWDLERALNAFNLMNEINKIPFKNTNLKQEPKNQSSERRTPRTSSPQKNQEKKLSKQKINSILENHELEGLFMLPDLNSKHLSRCLSLQDVVDLNAYRLLTSSGCLNWWDSSDLFHFLPLITTGDGNCLLHAASIALDGTTDEDLNLRKQLHDIMNHHLFKSAFYRRWRWEQNNNNKKSGLILSNEEWVSEWGTLVSLASPNPLAPDNKGSSPQLQRSFHSQVTNDNVSYSSLEEIHIFVLSHVLARPIIVLADKFYKNSKGEALAPIPFRGIYLPLELPASHCFKSPIHIAYHAAHFMALSPSFSPHSPPFYPSLSSQFDASSSYSAYVPLVDKDLHLLPVHFLHDPKHLEKEEEEEEEEDEENDANLELKLELLHQYLSLDLFQCEVQRGGERGECSGEQSEVKEMENPPGSINNSSLNDPQEEEKIKNKSKKLGKLKKLAESTSSNLKKTFNKGTFFGKSSLQITTPSKEKTQKSTPQTSLPIKSPNNINNYIIQCLKTKTKFPVAKVIYIKFPLLASSLEGCLGREVGDSLEEAEEMGIFRVPEIQMNNSLPLEHFNSSLTSSDHSDKMNLFSNKIVNNLKFNKVADKNNCRLNNFKDSNYFNKSFDEAKHRIKMNREMEEKAKNLLSNHNNFLRYSFSDNFKTYQPSSSVKLEKFTKVDNRMIKATETSPHQMDSRDKTTDQFL